MRVPMLGTRPVIAPPVGIDLGQASVKALQPGWGEHAPVSAVIPRDDATEAFSVEELRRLCAAIRRAGVRGSRARVSAPRCLVHTSSLEQPTGTPSAARRATARADLSRMHGLEPSEFELMTWPSPQPPKATPTDRFLAAVCPHADADVLLDGFEAGGLDVDTLVPASLSLAALLRRLGASGELQVVLDLGWHGAAVMACRDGIPVYERALGGTSLPRIVDELVATRGVAPDIARWIIARGRRTNEAAAAMCGPFFVRYAEALAAELRASLTYLRQCVESGLPSNIYAVGGGAKDHELLDVIGDQTGERVVPLDVGTGCDTALLGVAAGLASLDQREGGTRTRLPTRGAAA